MTRPLHTTFTSAAAFGCILLAPLAATAGNDRAGAPERLVRFEEVRMIIELNATDEDVGVQFFADAEGWRFFEIFDPQGREMYSSESEGRLARQGGGSELFVESLEPTLDDLPLEEFFARFPEGPYTFRGRMSDGDIVVGRADFTHVLPAGPEVLSPVGKGEECAEDVPIPALIAWKPVTRDYFGAPLEVVSYEIIVEGEDSNFDVHIPAEAGTTIVVPPNVLEPGTEYDFEILAIEEGGNQTITESCFVTAE